MALKPGPPAAEPTTGVEFLHVMLDPSCPLGHHVFADSDNNGAGGVLVTGSGIMTNNPIGAAVDLAIIGSAFFSECLSPNPPHRFPPR